MPLSVPFSTPAPESPEARDERLLTGIRAGEPRALEEAFHVFHAELYRLAYRYMRVRETAEDLIQDVFLRIWARRDQLTGVERLRPFLFGAVRNAALTCLRHERVEQKWSTGMSQFPPEPTDGVHDRDAQDLREELRDAIATLPPRAREAITLRWQRQMRNAEIAEVMGISLKGVEFSIARALNHLRRILKP